VPEPELADASRRTRLANERTLLAWIRSALAAFAVAIGTGKIIPGVTHVTRWPFELLGAGFAVLGVLLIVDGTLRFVRIEEALTAGEFAPLRAKNAVALGGIAGVLGIATLALIFVR
jgi:putative membrane protein